jgi:hypothetical protein
MSALSSDSQKPGRLVSLLLGLSTREAEVQHVEAASPSHGRNPTPSGPSAAFFSAWPNLAECEDCAGRSDSLDTAAGEP